MAAFGWLIFLAVRLICFHVCSGCNVWSLPCGFCVWSWLTFLPTLWWPCCGYGGAPGPPSSVPAVWPPLQPYSGRQWKAHWAVTNCPCDPLLHGAPFCELEQQASRKARLFIQRARPRPQQSSGQAVGCSHSLPLCA